MSRKSRPAFLPTLESVEKRDLAAAHGLAAAIPTPHVHDGPSPAVAAEVAGMGAECRRPRAVRQSNAYVSYVAFTLPTTGAQNVLNFLLTRTPYAGKQPTKEILYKGQTKIFLTADAAGPHSFAVDTYSKPSIAPPTTSTTPTRVPNYDFIYVGPVNQFKFVQDPTNPYVVYP